MHRRTRHLLSAPRDLLKSPRTGPGWITPRAFKGKSGICYDPHLIYKRYIFIQTKVLFWSSPPELDLPTQQRGPSSAGTPGTSQRGGPPMNTQGGSNPGPGKTTNYLNLRPLPPVKWGGTPELGPRSQANTGKKELEEL